MFDHDCDPFEKFRNKHKHYTNLDNITKDIMSLDSRLNGDKYQRVRNKLLDMLAKEYEPKFKNEQLKLSNEPIEGIN